MSLGNLMLMALAGLIFVAAATCAKLYAVDPGWGPLGGTLALYTAGNLVVLRVLREVGLALAMSLSAVIQLIVVNLSAVLVFRERLSGPQYVGLVLGVVAVALMLLFPRTDDS